MLEQATGSGVAKAFDDQCVENAELGKLIRKFFKIDDAATDVPELKLAKIPSRSQLLWGNHKRTGVRSLYPVVRIENVTIFPGIPRLLERAFGMIEHFFVPSEGAANGAGFHAFNTYLSCGEFEIAKTLSQLQDNCGTLANIGSYPKIDHSYYHVKVVVDSADSQVAYEVNEQIRAQLSEHLVDYDGSPLTNAVEKFDSYRRSLQKDTRAETVRYLRLIDEALATIRDVFERYRVESDCCISFNGGKDCTMLLHLMHIEMLRQFGKASLPKLKAIYVQPSETFDEVEKFVDETAERYNIEVVRITDGLKMALKKFKDVHPSIEPVFMGTRLSDFRNEPGTAGHALAFTDSDWPRYLRVQPVINWNYHAIWRFIRDLSLPYCQLYDIGYTSLGCKETTVPNDALKYKDRFGRVAYLPAFKLENESLERSNRKKNRL